MPQRSDNLIGHRLNLAAAGGGVRSNGDENHDTVVERNADEPEDPSNRRIRLSAKAVKEATEKGEARDYAERQQAEKSESFGSLASTLRDAMKRREK